MRSMCVAYNFVTRVVSYGFVLVLLLTGCQATPMPASTLTPGVTTPSPTPTAQPVATEPATVQPATAEPATAEPATAERATSQPAIATPTPPDPALPPPMTGEVVYMAGPREEGGSSLMKRIWNWQREQGNVPDCPECVDAIALVEPGHLGHKVWLRHPDGELVGPLMVVDTAAEEHRANLRARGRLGDISWELAQKWGMTGPLDGVTLYFGPPAEGSGENTGG